MQLQLLWDIWCHLTTAETACSKNAAADPTGLFIPNSVLMYLTLCRGSGSVHFLA